MEVDINGSIFIIVEIRIGMGMNYFIGGGFCLEFIILDSF